MGMEKDAQRSLGILLAIVGSVFYLQQAVFSDFFAHRNDFAHLYLAGYLSRYGGNFFDPQLMLQAHRSLSIPTGLNPFVYPPFFALLLRPLSWLTYDVAWLVFSLLSHAAWFLSLSLLTRLFRPAKVDRFLWWGMLLGFSAFFDPLHRTYAAGQVNTFLLLVLCAGWFLIRRNRAAWAGILFGLGAAIKVTPAFLLLYLALRRKWSGVLTGLAIFVLSVTISWMMLGAGVHREFLEEARRMSYGSSTWADLGMNYHLEPHNQAPSAFWYRLFEPNPLTGGVLPVPGLAPALSYLTALALLMGLVALTLRGKQPAAAEYFLWILVMLLLPSLLWDHYLVQATFGLAYLSGALLGSRLSREWTFFTALALISVPYPYLLFNQGWLIPLASIKLLGILLLMYFLLVNRQRLPEDEGERRAAE
jgi:hypothetical protein